MNKIKYEEAVKIRWENLAEKATRPNDIYHNNLLKNAIINDSKNKSIDMTELDNIEIKEDDPPIIEEMVKGNIIEQNKISQGHEKVLVGLDNAHFLAKKVIEKKLSVRQADNLVKPFKTKKIFF